MRILPPNPTAARVLLVAVGLWFVAQVTGATPSTAGWWGALVFGYAIIDHLRGIRAYLMFAACQQASLLVEPDTDQRIQAAAELV